VNPRPVAALRVHDTKTPLSGEKARFFKVEKSPDDPRKFRKDRVLQGFRRGGNVEKTATVFQKTQQKTLPLAWSQTGGF
jgi:hypothetical protein